MFPLKPIAPAGVAGALEKAERYRLLNDPALAESICLDVLAVEPANQRALVMLLLARTDQFAAAHGGETLAGVAGAREVLPRLATAYDRAYYAGLIAERRGRALLAAGGPGRASVAYHHFREAMECYQRAEPLRAPDNDDALLRWNTCARILNANPQLAPASPPRGQEPYEPIQGD